MQCFHKGCLEGRPSENKLPYGPVIIYNETFDPVKQKERSTGNGRKDRE